ncbi:hypothetical protein BJV77DRAFT_1007952 [Russula vinacea]|nr:hypothetical protein BJV77DRAFT_1007952 [Russula vinacea]
MRFTTWPVLPNAFIIFTAALLFLTPAANAQVDPTVLYETPWAGQVFYAGEQSAFTWFVDTGGHDLSNDTIQVFLQNADYNTAYQLTGDIPFLSPGSGPITFPPEAIPSTGYYIDLKYKNLYGLPSANFTIAYR